jgi:hypothetical protein
VADAPASDGSDGGDGGDGAASCTPACGPGLACVAGTCLPAPVVLARAPGCGAARLALAGANVYWTENATGAVKTLAVASPGATPTAVAAGQMHPGPIATDDVAVYWSNADDFSVMKAPLAGAANADAGAPPDGGADGGASPPLATAAAVVNGLLASGGYVYFSSGTSAYRVARAGGAPLTLATFATCKSTRPAALALDATFLYQTDFVSQFVTREKNDGTQLANDPCAAPDAGAPQIPVPETITHSQGELLFDTIARVGDEVVWADLATISAKIVVGTTPVSARQVASSAGSNAISGFAVSGGNVYLAESEKPVGGDTSDTIQVAPFAALEGGGDTPSGTVIALDQPGAASFAADATHVYWTTHTPSATAGAPDDCTIVSLAK